MREREKIGVRDAEPDGAQVLGRQRRQASLTPRMRVTHEGGTVLEVGPGEAYVIEPGHDSEILRDETFVG